MKSTARLLVFCLLWFLSWSILGYFISEENGSAMEFNCQAGFSLFQWRTFGTILLNNMTVGLLVSAGGFFTAGLLTLVVLIWNGFLLGQSLSLLTPDVGNLSFIAIHGLPEVFGLFMFSVIGLQGYVFFRSRTIPEWRWARRLLASATFATIIAAFLETALISNC